ncbi:hypothetical protein [Streptomyces chrestomyceticus]|uniref:Uncharacterized protein n=1 Tax=Streptomyces chrestomyceticus TaxID=68185 RepID=A0ABU7X1G4_9ACTN
MPAQPAVRQRPRLPDGSGTVPADVGSPLPTEPVEVAFTPVEPDGIAKDPGTGWLQPTGLVVHTGWHAPYPDHARPARPYEYCSSPSSTNRQKKRSTTVMNRSARCAVINLADTVTEGTSMVLTLLGGAIGAWAGYTYSPGTWPGDWRLAFAGGVAVVAAVAAGGMADLFLAPLRQLLTTARNTTRPQVGGHTASGAPATLEEGLAQVAAATEADAASRAASAAWHIDQSENFLRDEDRWRGYEDGEASYFLAPGVWLHYRSETNRYGNAEPSFTLLTGDADQPVSVTGMAQLRHHLAVRAAGLPVAPATATEACIQGDALAGDFTGLHA